MNYDAVIPAAFALVAFGLAMHADSERLYVYRDVFLGIAIGSVGALLLAVLAGLLGV